ncbi:unnamed protein product [Calypogeia fissa]
MGEENPLRDFLEKEVPDWKDDDFARGRFKAFTGQKQDWEEKLNFWMDLTVKVARHLDLIVIDTHSVQQKWFIRDGVVPMGLEHVLVEMKKAGELVTVEQVLAGGPSTFQWVGAMLKKTISWAVIGYAESELPVEERLVVNTILQEKVSQFLKILADGQYSSECIATLAKIKQLCGGSEEAELVVGRLLVQNKARFVRVAGGDQIEGFKISVNEKPVTPVSENDCHILQLQWTMEVLQLRLSTLDGRISMARNSVIKSSKAGLKREALRYVRSMKLLQLSREQCAGSMDKIEHVLSLIADAETTKKVSEAIQVGTTAMKDNHVSLEEVQHTLSELDEAITLQKETEEALAWPPLSTNEMDDDAALDEELALLEAELESEEPLPDVPKVPVVSQDTQTPQPAQPKESEVENELEKEFSKLALELG